MPECFEIAVFVCKHPTEVQDYASYVNAENMEVFNQYKYYIGLIEEYEDDDFSEVLISIEDVHIKKEALTSFAKSLLTTANKIFDAIPRAVLITGIYELTGYNLIDIHTISELIELSCKFPFVLKRKTDLKDSDNIFCENDEVACIYNASAQDIFK